VPRHSVESDAEEDEYNPLPAAKTVVEIDIKITYSVRHSKKLIVAVGDVARFWSKGVNLGEQTGLITVNGIQVLLCWNGLPSMCLDNVGQVGLIFNPPWTEAVILLSEVTAKLPPWAMHRYAQELVDSVQPSRYKHVFALMSWTMTCFSVKHLVSRHVLLPGIYVHRTPAF
jgi:glyoxylate carboligase